MILVDTSVWIDHLRGIASPEAELLAAAISHDEELGLCGIVLTEILQGIKLEGQYRSARSALAALAYLPTPRRAHVLAADVYRAARARGKVIRNTVDCIIAACAIVNDAVLLQKDRDFLTIAEVSRLRLLRV